MLIEDCPEEPSLCDEGYIEIINIPWTVYHNDTTNCFYQSDLNILQDFIDYSQNLENSPANNLLPIEMCGQVWIDRRLVNLCCSGNDTEQDMCYIDYELNIPDNIGDLSSLIFFSLEYNNLLSIPEGIGNLLNLEGLYLHNNQITSLPESIGNLTYLSVLDIDNNQITSIPESIGNLTVLTKLLLPVNQLTSIPESIGNLTNLTELYLFSNNLIDIPESIGYLSNLEILWLQNNQLTSLPQTICNIPEECYIMVGDNQLCDEFYYDCIDSWGEQDTSECVQSQIGNGCDLEDGEIGFLDCELCCWDTGLLSWLGDGYCDQFGGCAWEGPQFNCEELGYDCGDCNDDWGGADPSGNCTSNCLILGDVNNDSILNILDIVSIINLVLSSEYNECADVNFDGELNILDVVTLVNILLLIP